MTGPLGTTATQWRDTVARLLAPLGGITPKSVRPIPACAIPSAIVEALLDANPGVRVLKSGAMQEMPRDRYVSHKKPCLSVKILKMQRETFEVLPELRRSK